MIVRHDGIPAVPRADVGRGTCASAPACRRARGASRRFRDSGPDAGCGSFVDAGNAAYARSGQRGAHFTRTGLVAPGVTGSGPASSHVPARFGSSTRPVGRPAGNARGVAGTFARRRAIRQRRHGRTGTAREVARWCD